MAATKGFIDASLVARLPQGAVVVNSTPGTEIAIAALRGENCDGLYNPEALANMGSA